MILKMLDQDLFQIHSHKGVFIGNRGQVTTYAMLELNIEFTEFEIAIDEMNRERIVPHAGAEFGVLKKFLFTFPVNQSVGAH